MKKRLLIEGILVVALAAVVFFVVSPLLGNPSSSSTETPAPTEAAPTDAAPSDAAPSESSPDAETGAFKDGTYEAEAFGFGGMIQVVVTINGGSITDVQATGDSETVGIGSLAIEELPAKIVEAQSADVDGVSGATLSSNGVLDAAKSALKQAA